MTTWGAAGRTSVAEPSAPSAAQLPPTMLGGLIRGDRGPGTVLIVGIQHHPVRFALKRLVDVIGAVVLLAACIPIFLVVAVAIRIDGPGPVLFRQVRVGRHRRTFRICKFRTMRPDSESEVAAMAHLNEAQPPLFKVANDTRVTRVGRFLRRSSLDELPQLWNVLLGHMSLVGPRPPLPDEVAVDAVHQDLRLRVRPGMTGLWQVSGRWMLPYSRMIELDLVYVRRLSLRLDAWILVRTVGALITRRGAC